jgi:hypothetical protein
MIERQAMDNTSYASDFRLEYNQFTSMSQVSRRIVNLFFIQ